MIMPFWKEDGTKNFAVVPSNARGSRALIQSLRATSPISPTSMQYFLTHSKTSAKEFIGEKNLLSE